VLARTRTPYSCGIKNKAGGRNGTTPSGFIFSAVTERCASLIEKIHADQRDERNM
jgi:hypothetical protein